MKYKDAIRTTLDEILSTNQNAFLYGLGVDDCKGIFGSTSGLKEKFPSQVFDMPTSENAMTGIGFGACLNGMLPIMTHQRLDFFLLAMDQLVNNAAKWRFMFNLKRPTPMIIRLIIGRGWGQGPTHSQSLQSWFAHIPGLNVVMPTFPKDARGLLLSAAKANEPTIFLEHRWLYELDGDVGGEVPIGKAALVREGKDLTVVSLSQMTLEAMRTKLEADIIDLKSIRPIDWETIFTSVRKTKRLMVIDPAHPVCSVASEIMATVAAKFPGTKIERICFPDSPCPTSFELTRDWYPLTTNHPHDVPGNWFNGPF